MEILFGPNPVEEMNMLYKLQRKIKVFNTNDPLPNRGYNLVASSSKYGLVFVAVPDGVLTVYHLNQLINKECEPQHLTVQLQEKPTHIAVSCDFEMLAVTGGQLLSVYKITEFQNSNIAPLITIKTEANLSTFVVALQWNPCVPDSIAIAFYDGTLCASYVLTGNIKKVPSKARCICWSPKGKQLVTGNSDGTLTQYKPDLTPAKTVQAPNLFGGSPVEALAIYWIATFQFAVVFKNAADNSRPAVTILNTPKTGPQCCLNYEDICYSMGSNRPWYYYLQGFAQWNLILSSSSNGMEIATLASADGVNWQQWCQSDEARPELPLTDKKQENYPVGINIDMCAVHQLPWGENEILPHMPLLHVLSQTGLLTVFNIINLKKKAPQVCTPPEPLSLPAHLMSSAIPGEVPPEPAAPPPPVAINSEPQVSVIQQALQTSAPQPPSHFGSVAQIKVPSFQPQTSAAFAAPPMQVPELKPIVEIKPAAVPQPQPQPEPQTTVQPKPQLAQTPPKLQLTPQQKQENAAIKAEQDKINKIKADQELKNMLVKEVNDFQMEVYNFMVETRDTQIRLLRDFEAMRDNFNDTKPEPEDLKKACLIEELNGALNKLKLELVRACAAVAEAKSHAEAKELHQWTQTDPLTSKRIASVKNLAYYVKTQLDQAHKALDYKWNEITSQYDKPVKHMIRPILDDVYQPLVKQQEILCRQQAVLRTLKNTLNECDIGPVFKSTSLLRSTPFRNNKDPLSKLTKNILNMSIESETKPRQSLLTPRKLEALRDTLSNHKTIKIKPVNVEYRQHLATMREKYEKSLEENSQVPNTMKIESDANPQVQAPVLPQMPTKVDPKPSTMKPTVPGQSYTRIVNTKQTPPAFTNVARTLFTDEPKQEQFKSQFGVQDSGIKPHIYLGPKANIPTATGNLPTGVANIPTAMSNVHAFGSYPATTGNMPTVTGNIPTAMGNTSTATDAKTVLKDLLTTKQANKEAKNNSNTFMGQKICSPTAFETSLLSPSSTPSSIITSKPIADINNMVNKFQPFVPETKPLATKPNDNQANVNSSETGEPEETTTSKVFDIKPEYKPMSNLFGMKSQPLGSSTPNVPDVLQSAVQDKQLPKPLDKAADNTKENIPEKSSESVLPQVTVEKKETPKPFSVQTPNKSLAFGASQSAISAASSSEVKPLDLKTEVQPEPNDTEPDATEKSSSVFASVNASITVKSQSSTPPPTTVDSDKTETPTTNSESEANTNLTPTTASSIFSAAVVAQPKTTGSLFSTESSSIFGSTSQSSIFGATTTSSVFGSKPSIFSTSTPSLGTATTASSVFGQTSTTQSVFTSSAAAVFASGAQSSAPAFGTEKAASVFSSVSATTTTPSVFVATSDAGSVFGSTSTPAFGNSTASVFESNPPSPPSVFAPTTTSPSPPSVFGTTPTTQSPVFGATTTAASAFSPTTTSIFGTATTTASIFASSPSQASSVFGQATQSVFGAPIIDAPTIFGATTQASVFGSPSSTQTSVFGSPTQTTQANIFGAPVQTTQSSIFGSPAAAAQPSVFGGSPQANQASVFGSPQTTQASIFGSQAAPTAVQGSLFGGGESNLFASATISTTSAPSQTSGGNIFSGSSSGSVFGGASTNVFGGSSAFGQSSQASSIFGGAASFGQKPASSIWGGGGNTTGGFGSSGFGQQATTQSSSIFGSSTGGSFSAPSAGAFGTPQQTSPFGSPQQQQAPAFGGSPGFGSQPVFGQSTGFGSPTSSGFGAAASFGGFNKSPTGGFGAPAAFGGTAFGGGGSPGGGQLLLVAL